MTINHILHVDDDVEDLEIFETALKQLDKEITYSPFTNGKEALETLAANRLKPDVVFLDLNMPVMTGQQFLLELSNRTELKKIPVIIYTTSAHSATISLMKELGAHDFITKHNNINELVADLQRLIY